jgi:hypothetical protein
LLSGNSEVTAALVSGPFASIFAARPLPCVTEEMRTGSKPKRLAGGWQFLKRLLAARRRAGGNAGYLYNVTLDGERVLERSRDPETDLARVLLGRGITGMVAVHDGKTGKVRTRVNVEKAAKVRVSEENRAGLRWRKYRETTDIASHSPEDEALVPCPQEQKRPHDHNTEETTTLPRRQVEHGAGCSSGNQQTIPPHSPRIRR